VLDRLKWLISQRFGSSRWELQPVSSGFSGTPIYRLHILDRDYAIRGWPKRPESVEKVRDWYEATRWVAPIDDGEAIRWVAPIDEQCLAPIDLAPEFQHFPIPAPLNWGSEGHSVNLLSTDEDRLWSLATWLPGSPMTLDQSRSISKPVLARQLAKLHFLLSRGDTSVGKPQGLVDRREGLDALLENLTVAKHAMGKLPITPQTQAQFWEMVQRHKSTWKETLRILLTQDRYVHWIVRDLWRDNLLLDSSGQWVSTVDVGASRVDWPAFDFLRLFGSLGCSLDEWQPAYETYTRHGVAETLPTLSECLVLHKISTALSIHHWIGRLNESTVHFGDVDGHNAYHSYRRADEQQRSHSAEGFLRLNELLNEFLSS
jgi:hypothetical protein